MNPFDYWFKRNLSLRKYIENYLRDNMILLKDWRELWGDCRTVVQEGGLLEKTQVMTLLEAMKRLFPTEPGYDALSSEMHADNRHRGVGRRISRAEAGPHNGAVIRTDWIHDTVGEPPPVCRGAGFSIRALRAEDMHSLLDFYLTFSENERYFFQPFPVTAAGLTAHLSNVGKGTTVAFVVIDSAGLVAGHAFVRGLPPVLWRKVMHGVELSPHSLFDFTVGLVTIGNRALRQMAGMPILPRFGIGLLPAARGLGLGAALTVHTLKAARARGTSKVALVVHKANRVAIDLYERIGFRFTCSISQQEPGDSIGMVIDLAPDFPKPFPS